MDEIAAIGCVIFENGLTLIAGVEDLSLDLEEPKWNLINVFKIDSDGELVKWPEVSDDRDVVIVSNSVLSVVNPKKEILVKYLELTAE